MTKEKPKKKKKVLAKDHIHPSRRPITHDIKVGDTVVFTKETVGNLGGFKIGEETVVLEIKEDKWMQGGFMITVEPSDHSMASRNPKYPIVYFTNNPMWFGAGTTKEREL